MKAASYDVGMRRIADEPVSGAPEVESGERIDGVEAEGSFEYGGDRVACDVFGEGPPVVLVHGTPFSSYVWRRTALPEARDG